MAKAVEQEQSSAEAGSTAVSPPAWQQRLAGATSALAPRLAGVRRALAPRPPTARSASPQQGGMFKSTMRMMFGMLLFVLGAETIGPLLASIDLRLHLGLEKVRFAPPNTPILGGLTGLLLIWFLAIFALWLVLRRFNIIPRDLYGMSGAAARRTNQPQVTTLRSGPPRTRAERRHAAEAAASAAPAKGTAKRNSSSRGTAVVTRSASARGSRPVTGAPRATGVPGEHDDAYERARAAERARRRRAARR